MAVSLAAHMSRPQQNIRSSEMQQPPSQPRAYSQAYLPNGAAPQPSGPVPGARPLEPNQGRVQQVGHARVLCIADVRGEIQLQMERNRLKSFADSGKATFGN